MTNDDTREVYKIARMIAREEIALALKEQEKVKPQAAPPPPGPVPPKE